MSVLANIGSAVSSLGQGLFVTIKNFTVRRPITVQYPEERLELSDRFRGYVEFLFSPQSEEPLCTACLACERICPVKCIVIQSSRKPEGGGMRPDVYMLDHGMCIQCGLCIEVCPVDALAWNKGYERSTTDRNRLTYQYRRQETPAQEQTETGADSQR